MTSPALNLSSFDVRRIETLFSRDASTHALSAHLDALLDKINSCTEVPPVGVPPFIVTMNSQVRLLDIESGKEAICTLVFPANAESSAGRISVLAPLGAMLLGERVGSTINVPAPLNVRRYRIIEILFQPEAAGQYNL